MDVEPPVGDDLNRMLVSMKQQVLQRAAAEPPAKPRPWARRHLGLTLGLVALLGIGGASGALALVLPSPFEAAAPASPTSTPEPSATPRATATPTFTPSAPEQDPVPRPAYDVDCATLGDQIGVTGVIATATPIDLGPGQFRPATAAYRQAGALACTWTPTGDPYEQSRVSVTVVPAGDRGLEWISGLRQSGLPSLGLGDASAAACDPGASSCNTSVVVGPWWFQTSSNVVDPVTYASTASVDTVRPVVAALVEQLAAATPPPAWKVPEGAWQLAGCEAAPSSEELSRAVGEVDYEPVVDHASLTTETGIETTQLTDGHCSWSVLPDASVSYSFSSLDVRWVTGGGWAPGTATLPGRPVEVAGADRATAGCISDEGTGCWIDVVVADSWVHVSTGVTEFTDDTPLRLIPAVEAIIAAGTRG